MVAGLARARSLFDALKSGDFSYAKIQWGQKALVSLHHRIDQRGHERGTAFVGYLHKNQIATLRLQLFASGFGEQVLFFGEFRFVVFAECSIDKTQKFKGGFVPTRQIPEEQTILAALASLEVS